MWKVITTGICSLLLVFLTYELPVWLPDTFNEEYSLVNILSKLRGEETDEVILKHLKDNFLLVNTAYDMSLAEISDKEHKTSNYFYRKQATSYITNRERLFHLLTWLEQHPDIYNIIILDMVFYNWSYTPEQKTYDSAVFNVIRKLADTNKIILAADYNSDHTIKKGLLEKYVPDHAYGDVRANLIASDNLAIYALSTKKGVTSMPLLMLNRIDSVDYERTTHRLLNFKYIDGKNKRSLDYMIPKLYVNEHTLMQLNRLNVGKDNVVVNMIELGDVYEQADYILDNTKLLTEGKPKKNILIGNFYGGRDDLHATLYGPTKGPLYILNAYYNLREGNSLFNWWAATFLWMYYFSCLGWILFIPKKDHRSDTFRKYVLHDLILKNWHYLSLIIIITLYYLLFDQVINLLYISVIFLLLEIFVKIYRNYLEIKVK